MDQLAPISPLRGGGGGGGGREGREEVGEVGFHFLLLLIRSAKPEKVERPEPLFRTGSSAEEERGCSGGHDVSSGPNI